MARMTIEVPDELVPALLDAFAVVYGLPEGVTKTENARFHIRKFIRETYRQAQVDAARESAAAKADDDAGGITVT